MRWTTPADGLVGNMDGFDGDVDAIMVLDETAEERIETTRPVLSTALRDERR